MSVFWGILSGGKTISVVGSKGGDEIYLDGKERFDVGGRPARAAFGSAFDTRA